MTQRRVLTIMCAAAVIVATSSITADDTCESRWSFAEFLVGTVASDSVIKEFRSEERDAWEPVLRPREIDLGQGPVNADIELCLDDSNRIVLVAASIRADSAMLQAQVDGLEDRWTHFLGLGVSCAVTDSGGTGFFSAVAFDECGYHAFVNWSETGEGHIAGVSVAIAPDMPSWVDAHRDGSFAIDHKAKALAVWRYSQCSQRFTDSGRTSN